jgi:glycosyltransferase involved in cell wall biosynthesis
MKILFINTTGGYFGGVEQNIALAAKGLTLAGHKCYFACVKNSGIDQRQFDSLFIKTWLVSSNSLSEIVNEISPDVFYLHKWDHIEEILNVKGTKRLVRMIHDHDLYCPRKHKYYTFSRKICTHRCGLICYADLAFLERKEGKMGLVSIRKKIVEMKRNKSVDTFLVGSNYMKKELERNSFNPATIKLLPPCVQGSSQALQSFPTQPSILFVGQLIKGKGVDILLNAYELLIKELDTPIPLHIIGRGNEEEALQQSISESTFSSSITFHGWVAHDHLSTYYDASTVVVVPSRWPEPFGMVGVEAMLRERPVIGANVGGIPDWIDDGENGFLVPPNDPEALCKALISLVRDLERAKRMGKTGKRMAKDLFSYEKYIHNLEYILET